MSLLKKMAKNTEKLPISLIILTYNEELNLENCLKNAAPWVGEIFVVDSFSTDKTLEIAEKYKAKTIQHEFKNQARQFNWALDNLPVKNEWIMRLDADEYVLPELWEEIAEKLSEKNISINQQYQHKSASAINGFYMKRRVYFMGKWMRHGGYYPTWILRLFRKGKAMSEDREMDEHIILSEGRAENLENDFVDDNKKGLEAWTDRQNKYSSREVRQILDLSRSGEKDLEKLGGPVADRRRIKERYNNLPIFGRAFLYFFVRYFFLGGFLDGKEGMIFHFLHGFWYRFLIDAKLYESGLKNK
ncbi:MAG: glycosyltransferase family 2 protein [Candidatus Wolfebacteria bacterium]|nr:glycosyltransferase family 2 protein [Candidatus Wolfebacteria bacterium]